MSGPRKRSQLEILRAHGIRPTRKRGQNFLTDGNMARKIVELCQIRPEDQVIEIGAGTGALTRLLVDRGIGQPAADVLADDDGVIDHQTGGQ